MASESNELTVVPVDSDVPAKVLPEAAPEGVQLVGDGPFLAYDQTMEVFRSMQTIIDRVAKEPQLVEREEARPPQELPNCDWLACFLWAMTVPSRKGTELEAITPAALMRRIARKDARRLNAEMIGFLKEMNPDPNAE